jgi:flagella basal body P-ring formation protein FlgA
MGQLIKVQNLQSKREFTARVAGPNRVEIKLED